VGSFVNLAVFFVPGHLGFSGIEPFPEFDSQATGR
jgi:hypothetical protein